MVKESEMTLEHLACQLMEQLSVLERRQNQVKQHLAVQPPNQTRGMEQTFHEKLLAVILEPECY